MSFLCRSRAPTLNWKSRIPRSWLVHPWDEVAYVIRKFITYEGRYIIIFLYHIRLLQHWKQEKEMNMPYYFLNSLSKMAKGIQKQDKNEERSLYHHRLIKMIISHELQKQNITWHQFLVDNKFVEEEEFVPDDDEEDDKVQIIMAHEATKPKQPMGTRRLTRSMVKE